MTVIEIRPHRWDWKAFESSGVERETADAHPIGDTAGREGCRTIALVQILAQSADSREWPYVSDIRRARLTLGHFRQVTLNHFAGPKSQT
jgi:hypothetical protein